MLRDAGINHVYRQVSDSFIYADLVMPSEVEFRKYELPVFIPSDLTEHGISLLPKAPPIEIILKSFHGGTSKHRYIGMDNVKVRESNSLFGGMPIVAEGPYPHTIIRFDWRNPFAHNGVRVMDEVLPESVADWFIDVRKATHTALKLSLIHI